METNAMLRLPPFNFRASSEWCFTISRNSSVLGWSFRKVEKAASDFPYKYAQFSTFVKSIIRLGASISESFDRLYPSDSGLSQIGLPTGTAVRQVVFGFQVRWRRLRLVDEFANPATRHLVVISR